MNLLNVRTVWIMGAGYFGKRAVHALSKRFPNVLLTVVDRSVDALTGMDGLSIECCCEDVIDFLERRLTQPAAQGHWIVPAVPFHLAAFWLQRKLAVQRSVRMSPVPQVIAARLPNLFRGSAGEAYMSNADFRCPANCPQPKTRCTHSGLPRPRVLYRFLSNLGDDALPSMVLRSHTLAPGVGGVESRTLLELLEKLLVFKREAVLVSTACACHGVIHALRFE